MVCVRDGRACREPSSAMQSAVSAQTAANKEQANTTTVSTESQLHHKCKVYLLILLVLLVENFSQRKLPARAQPVQVERQQPQADQR